MSSASANGRDPRQRNHDSTHGALSQLEQWAHKIKVKKSAAAASPRPTGSKGQTRGEKLLLASSPAKTWAQVVISSSPCSSSSGSSCSSPVSSSSSSKKCKMEDPLDRKHTSRSEQKPSPGLTTADTKCPACGDTISSSSSHRCTDCTKPVHPFNSCSEGDGPEGHGQRRRCWPCAVGGKHTPNSSSPAAPPDSVAPLAIGVGAATGTTAGSTCTSDAASGSPSISALPAAPLATGVGAAPSALGAATSTTACSTCTSDPKSELATWDEIAHSKRLKSFSFIRKTLEYKRGPENQLSFFIMLEHQIWNGTVIKSGEPLFIRTGEDKDPEAEIASPG
eukprot:g80019.t1